MKTKLREVKTPPLRCWKLEAWLVSPRHFLLYHFPIPYTSESHEAQHSLRLGFVVPHRVMLRDVERTELPSPRLRRHQSQCFSLETLPTDCLVVSYLLAFLFVFLSGSGKYLRVLMIEWFESLRMHELG